MDRLPQEVKRQIALKLCQADAKSLALVGKGWDKAAAPVVWQELLVNDDMSMHRLTFLVHHLRQSPIVCSYVKELQYTTREYGVALPILAEVLELVGPTVEKLAYLCKTLDERPINLQLFCCKVQVMSPFTMLRELKFDDTSDWGGQILYALLERARQVRTLDLRVDFASGPEIPTWPIFESVVEANICIDECKYDEVADFITKCPGLVNFVVALREENRDYSAFPVQDGRSPHTALQRIRLPICCPEVAVGTEALLKCFQQTESIRQVIIDYACAGLDPEEPYKWFELELPSQVEELVVQGDPHWPKIMVPTYIDSNMHKEHIMVPALIESDVLEKHVLTFYENDHLIRVLVSRPEGQKFPVGIPFNEEKYDGILVRSYTDLSSHRQLFHFRFIENAESFKVTYRQGDRLDSYEGYHALENQEWSSLAIINDKPLAEAVLKRMYEWIGEAMDWTEPARGIVLGDEVWTMLDAGMSSIEEDYIREEEAGAGPSSSKQQRIV